MFFLSSIIFVVWVVFIIFLYYTKNSSHLTSILWISWENPINNFFTAHQWLFLYVGVFLILYIIYKIFSPSRETKTEWKWWSIMIAFLVQLFGVCFLYTQWKALPYSTFTIFLHILQMLVYPVFLVLLWRAIGASILRFLWEYEKIPTKLAIIFEITIGLGIFAFILGILGFFGVYTLQNLMISLILLTIASFHGWKISYNQAKSSSIIIENSKTSLQVISAELAFFVFSFVASASFVSILRPMPIGWDDLGVYMNFPKIIAHTGSLLQGAGMQTWQLITGTGFLFEQTAAQAFFVNQIGGILSTFAIIASISFFQKKWKKLIAIPMILGIVYYIMPMTVFQQAKDMKLDPALMFVTISAVMAMFLGIRGLFWKNFSQKTGIFFLLLAGIFTGIAFGIKVTTLLLILGLLAFFTYMLLGFLGLIGFTGIFIAIFTQLKLWSFLFVWMPENTSSIVSISLVLGLLGYIFALKKYKNHIKTYFIGVGIFLFGIFSAVVPWVAYNLSTAQEISINTLLNGDGTGKENGTLLLDFEKIYTKEELEALKKSENFTTITSDGQSHNEDWSRYFGQEKWLNNYLKLPINLTLQQNQTGEFTDITYIFLAFTPVCLLFLQRKKQKYDALWIAGISFFLIIALLTFTHVFAPLSQLSENITNFLSQITLPLGYAVLIVLIFGFFALMHFLLKNDTHEEREIRGLIILLGFYGLIFWVSAFGVVWYGVSIYFFMLLLISLAFNAIDYKTQNTSLFGEIFIKSFFFISIGIYIFGSALVHAHITISSSGYDEYKYRLLSQDSAIFAYKPDYFTPISELNITNIQELKEEAIKSIENSQYVSTILKNQNIDNTTLSNISLLDINQLLQQILQQSITTARYDWKTQKTIPLTHNEIKTNEVVHEEVEKILSNIYQKILYPTKETENKWNIYRIGTFMTYFINNNRSRFYEDSLIQNFQTYFYNENPDETIRKMKDVWLKYLLVDLNAATIDKDDRHALTTRYENLLLSMRSQNLRLIDTDNNCLRIALDEYHNGNLQDSETFLKIAGTNYKSYKDAHAITPQEKQLACMTFLFDGLSKQNFAEKYSYLTPVYNALIAAGADQEQVGRILQNYAAQRSWFAVFEIK